MYEHTMHQRGKTITERGNAWTRRHILQGAAAATLVLLAPARIKAADHTHSQTTPSTSKHRDVVDAATACVGSGETCLKHILDQSAAGDNSLAACGMRVHEMIAVCRALVTLAASDSPQLKPFAKVCIEICRSCEVECRKHEQHHAICKETADSCERVISSCEKLISS